MKRLLILVWLLLFAVVAGLAVGYARLHQSPFDAVPSQLDVCSRTYVLPAPHGVTRESIDTQALTVQAHVRTWQGRRAVWGKRTATSCGLAVYLQVGSNDFRSYSLSGSP
jgi:hypothetical protein